MSFRGYFAATIFVASGCGLVVGEDFKGYTYDPCADPARSACTTGGGGNASGGNSSAVDSGDASSPPNNTGGIDLGTGGVQAGSGGISPSTGGNLGSNPSCEALSANCGPDANDDCCASDAVPAGLFMMGRNSSLHLADRPEHPVEISAFKLDRYEVTVGRFRNFVKQYDTSGKPTQGTGRHPSHLSSGWQTVWNTFLPSSAEELRQLLRCEYGGGGPTWTNEPAGRETYAINCMRWYEAFAFCIWDGARLPTEAEWEYAAAGGSEQRTYPWGNEFQWAYANYDSTGHTVLPVGQAGAGLGKGRWGHYDLVGNVWDWTRDTFDENFYSTLETAGTAEDPLNPFFADNSPVLRGASWAPNPIEATTTFHRVWSLAWESNTTIGVRCARDL